MPTLDVVATGRPAPETDLVALAQAGRSRSVGRAAGWNGKHGWGVGGLTMLTQWGPCSAASRCRWPLPERSTPACQAYPPRQPLGPHRRPGSVRGFARPCGDRLDALEAAAGDQADALARSICARQVSPNVGDTRTHSLQAHDPLTTSRPYWRSNRRKTLAGHRPTVPTN